MAKNGVVIVACEYKPFPGGIATYAGSLIDVLSRRGIRSHVIAPMYPEYNATASENGITRLFEHHKIRLRIVPSFVMAVRRLGRDNIVLAADIRSLMLLFFFRFFHRCRYRVMVHGSEASKFRRKPGLFSLIKKAYRSAELVTFNSVFTRHIFEDGLGIFGNGRISYLGVDESWFVRAGGDFQNVDLAAIPATTKIICSVGRLEPRKGQLEAVEVIARVREELGDTDLVYVVVGRPEEVGYAQAILDEAKRRAVKVILTGYLCDADIKRLFARSACHLLFAQALTGKVEGFGLVLLEAAAQGCPSVATDVGGIGEALRGTGVVVGASDLKGAAAAIVRYLRDNEFRRVEGKRSKNAASEFTWQKCASITFPEFF